VITEYDILYEGVMPCMPFFKYGNNSKGKPFIVRKMPKAGNQTGKKLIANKTSDCN
jgi:hypothetical protein